VKAKGKRQEARGKSSELWDQTPASCAAERIGKQLGYLRFLFLPFAFCLLPFAFTQAGLL
jgi:hypothetical protein